PRLSAGGARRPRPAEDRGRNRMPHRLMTALCYTHGPPGSLWRRPTGDSTGWEEPMGLKERRAEAEALHRAAQSAEGEGALPPKTFVHGGYAFLLADLDLQVSILGKPIATVDFGMAELRGKLQGLAGPPPYRTEVLSEAYTYPLFIRDPEGKVSEAYLYQGEDGPTL